MPRAGQRLEELLKLDPNSALGHYYLGRVRAKSKLYLAAEQSYRKALEFNPKSEAVLLDLALVYELEGKTEEAMQTYQRLFAGQCAKCLGAPAPWASFTSGKTNWMKRLRQFESAARHRGRSARDPDQDRPDLL